MVDFPEIYASVVTHILENIKIYRYIKYNYIMQVTIFLDYSNHL